MAQGASLVAESTPARGRHARTERIRNRDGSRHSWPSVGGDDRNLRRGRLAQGGGNTVTTRLALTSISSIQMRQRLRHTAANESTHACANSRENVRKCTLRVAASMSSTTITYRVSIVSVTPRRAQPPPLLSLEDSGSRVIAHSLDCGSSTGGHRAEPRTDELAERREGL